MFYSNTLITNSNLENIKETDLENIKENVHDHPVLPESVNSNDLEFNRHNIEALVGKGVSLTDFDYDNDLDMFCHDNCTENDNELTKQCRGVVFNKNNIVMKTFPFTTELNNTETDKISKALEDFKKWSFFEAHEGTLIRLFNFNDKWFLSTHRKLNAFKSKWASRESFGTNFKNALMVEEENNPIFRKNLPEGNNILDRFQSTLDVKKQYMFLICNTNDNRIVCKSPEKEKVYHVGTFVNGFPVFTENVNIPCPPKLDFFDVNDLLNFVETIDYEKYQGVIGFTSDNKQIKVVNKYYQNLFKARGNQPSIKFRYLQVRMERKTVDMLYDLYPESVKFFEEYENIIFEIARKIFKLYMNRFIKKIYVIAPPDEFAIIRICHTWHMTNQTNNRISHNQVLKVLNEQHPTRLNRMIHNFKLDSNKEQNNTQLHLNLKPTENGKKERLLTNSTFKQK